GTDELVVADVLVGRGAGVGADAQVGAGAERVLVDVAVPVDGRERGVPGVDAAVEHADEDALTARADAGAGVPGPHGWAVDDLVADVGVELPGLVRLHGDHARQVGERGGLL